MRLSLPFTVVLDGRPDASSYPNDSQREKDHVEGKQVGLVGMAECIRHDGDEQGAHDAIQQGTEQVLPPPACLYNDRGDDSGVDERERSEQQIDQVQLVYDNVRRK